MISHALLLPLLAAVTNAAQFTVTVGANGLLAFNPQNITANPGDQINFEFHPKNHSMTQSSFASPCSPLSGGVNSGFMPVSPNATAFPTFSVIINDTKPFWAYCAQPGPPAHCVKGMVFAANAPTSGPNTYEAFLNEALALGTSSSSSTTDVSSFTTPTPVVQTVTQTVTLSNSVYTTTYASWEGSSPDPTPAAAPAVHTVQVGTPQGNFYSPTNLSASIGDTIMFVYNAKNHTASQSTFNNPCSKASNGFDSGFMPFNPNTTSVHPTFNITVNDTQPIWVYCRQTGHCQAGMVLAINAPTSGPDTYDAFLQLALHSNASSTASGSSSGTTTSSSSTASSTSGAGRTAVSAGLLMGVTAFLVTALL